MKEGEGRKGRIIRTEKGDGEEKQRGKKGWGERGKGEERRKNEKREKRGKGMMYEQQR